MGAGRHADPAMYLFEALRAVIALDLDTSQTRLDEYSAHRDASGHEPKWTPMNRSKNVEHPYCLKGDDLYTVIADALTLSRENA
jgi:hypothetical protein